MRNMQDQVPRSCASVDELASHFDIFLIDQFGVLHNGSQAFPGSPEALQRLRQLGKTCVIISNSGKRAALNAARLDNLGFPASAYHSVMTSGEVAWNQLKQGLVTEKINPGARCYLLVNDADYSLLDGLELQSVDSVTEADLVLLAGMGAERLSLDAYLDLFNPVIERTIPCICTNPDKVSVSASGKHFSVGRIAEELELRGADITWIGKPYTPIYDAILDGLNVTDRSRVICVGDSIEHDIAGGASAGLSTALVRTGILDDLTDENRQAEYARYAVCPDYILPAFI